MACRFIEQILPLYVDDVAEESQVQMVEEHLQSCSGCRALLEQLRQDRQALMSLDIVAPPLSLRASIMQQVAAEGKPSTPRRRLAIPQLASLAAALLIAVLVGNMYVLPSYYTKLVQDDGSLLLAGVDKEPPGGEELIADPTSSGEIGISGVPQDRETSDRSSSAEYEAGILALPAEQSNYTVLYGWLITTSLAIVVWLAAATYYLRLR